VTSNRQPGAIPAPPITEHPRSAPDDVDPWRAYDATTHWDEMLAPEGPRTACDGVMDLLRVLGPGLFERQAAAELAIQAMGISFTVYSEGANIDRAWPFDVIPRVMSTHEWNRISAGLTQRLEALNLFIDDVYGEGRAIRNGVVPAEVVGNSTNLRPECRGVRPPRGTWAHISGSDLVRDGDGTMYVLEDNLRVPSGVSYMLENRQITKRVFADALP